MIHVTRLDGSDLVVNAELIETIEQRPDTVISLTTGRKLVVQQSAEEIVERVILYQRRIHGPIEIITRSKE
ncbi:MAG: flagellar FlbD family protein [Chloroflexi bacterium]|nr:flagellar FlbD family protein [Chloroflexota bacterium]